VLARVLVYGVFGCACELAFTAASRRPKLPSAWMLPIYGLAALAFPPLRDAVRERSIVERASAYAIAMIFAEYAIGRSLRASFAAAPWRYDSGFAVDGVTRLDYLPLWALYGLALERLDDVVARGRRYGRGQ
jgi:hypothetical protein